MRHALTLRYTRNAMFSCKFFLAIAFTFATLIALPPGAEAQRGGGPSGTPPSYRGPCDVIRGGCAEAYSVTRAMKASYAGPLFQLVRLSDNKTLNIGQTNHLVNISGVPAFCNRTYCLYNLIYGQVNRNTWHAPIKSVEGGRTPPYCTTATACASIWWIDPETGLPAVRTPYPAGYIGPHISAGIPGGTHAMSLMMDGRNDAYTTCCGQFIVGHYASRPDVIGSIFGMQYSYGNPTATYIECSTAFTFCSGGEYEEQHDYADYGSSLGDVIQMINWDGAAATNKVNDYINGTLIFSVTPPDANCGGTYPSCKNGGTVGRGINLTAGTQTSLGYGGDNSHSDIIFREGIITNGVMSVTDEATARNNMTTFYSSRSPAHCYSTADMSYYFDGQNPSDFGANAVGSSLLAVGLRQMRASQTGPIVDLRDVVTNTVNTYGPAASGCGIDPAATTFCATHGCAVATLYNQGTFSTSTSSSAHDLLLDMTATAPSVQPTVTFNSLNGLPTMHFTGRQMLCTRTLPNLTLPNVPIGWSVVAKRTPSAGAGAAAAQKYTPNGAITLLGWGSGANTFNYWVATGSPSFTGTASDGHWHQMGWESISRAGNVANDYLDSATLSSSVRVGVSGTSFRSGQVCIGGRPDTGPSLSGDVAELVISLPKDPTSVGFSSLEPTIFSRDEAAWGMLPH